MKKSIDLPFDDGIDRRGFLKCMQWAGTGLIWSMSAGVPVSRVLAADTPETAGFSFVQISDSHIGFNKPANPDVTGTLQGAIDKINGLDAQPSFLIHTGDLTHLARADEFDTLEQMLKTLRQKQIYYVPGEHDVAADDGKVYLERFGKGTMGMGWQSFDYKDVHFVGINNVVQLEGLGRIGREQLEWLRQDLMPVSSSRPIVVFAHIPLWTVYPEWGWGTEDSAQALGLLKRFGSVTVLNGHIHQVLQKVEGNVTFHSAMSTAFPQPAPGSAASAGPMKVPSERLKQVLGVTRVNSVAGARQLAIVDSTLQETGMSVDMPKGR
jgi:3',5'-cyclic AMP phosphodiesterase CpdA